MPNIYRYEPQIDNCNLNLLKSFLESANQGDRVQLKALVQKYAFDILFAVAMGKHAGFLDSTADIAAFVREMENWKHYTMATGAATRLFPRVAQFLRRHDIRNSFEQLVYSRLNASRDEDLGCPLNRPAEEGAIPLRHVTEACMAIVLAGADPLITHLQSSLFHIYNDKDLLEQLRDEIANVKLSQPPKIKELVYGTLEMPLLHAVLRESLRLQQPYTNSVRLMSPKGGVVVVDVLIPEGVSYLIAFTRSTSNVRAPITPRDLHLTLNVIASLHLSITLNVLPRSRSSMAMSRSSNGPFVTQADSLLLLVHNLPRAFYCQSE